MSEEFATPVLVANVRAIFKASTPRDWATVLTFYARDAVWETPFEGQVGGHAALRDLWESFAGIYQDWELDLDEGRDLGYGVVLAVFTMRGHLAESGGEVQERGAWVYEWADGKIVRVLDYRDIDEARAAAERLAEERGSAMSQENVAAMWRIVNAINRKDYEAAVTDLDDEVKIDDADIPEATGGDSFLAWIGRWDEAWESWRAEDFDIRAADDDQVIATFTMIVKGRGSGLELRRSDALVASFRRGRALKLGYYNDQSQALKALGLAE